MHLLTQLKNYLEQLPNCQRYLIAYSGGRDSHVLLHAISQLVPAQKILAIHINHGLSPHADQWQQHCQQICQNLGVNFKAITIKVKAASNIEAIARQERYKALESQVTQGDCLLMAHHQQDQAETLLLQLLRGAGPKGLSAMPWRQAFGQGNLIRPLLGITAETIQAYAQQQQLQWVEDETNASMRFDRNYLRHSVLPLLAQRWPQAVGTISRSAALCAETTALVEELAQQDLLSCQIQSLTSLKLSVLTRLSVIRQKNLLRYWFQQHQIKMPNQAVMEEILKQIHAQQDAVPDIRWHNAEIRRYRDQLYLFSPSLIKLETSCSFVWPDLSQELDMQALGLLHTDMLVGKGIAANKVAGKALTISFRQGGEYSHPYERAHSHPLKKIFQEKAIPPWLRDYIPLIYVEDQLVAVADLWVEKFWAANGDQPGYQVNWQGAIAELVSHID